VTGASEALEPGAWSTINLGVIDLDTTELQSNDRDIYEAVLECMLANPVELGIEAPEAATSTAAASADVGASSSGALMPGATSTEQPTPGQGGDVGGPAPSIASKAAEGVLGESVAGAESAVITPPLPTTGAIVDVPPPLIAGATPPPKIQETGGARARPYRGMPRLTMSGSSISPTFCGRPPSRSTTTPRRMRSLRHATHSSVDWRGRAVRSTS
jgi:hypothetical protein